MFLFPQSHSTIFNNKNRYFTHKFVFPSFFSFLYPAPEKPHRRWYQYLKTVEPTLIMLPPSWSSSLYPLTVMDAGIHCTKKDPDYFSFQPRFGYNGWNERKIKMKDPSRAQFYKACKHNNLLSTQRYCLAESGYQPKLHLACIVVAGARLNFSLAKTFVKHCFLFISFMK